MIDRAAVASSWPLQLIEAEGSPGEELTAAALGCDTVILLESTTESAQRLMTWLSALGVRRIAIAGGTAALEAQALIERGAKLGMTVQAFPEPALGPDDSALFEWLRKAPPPEQAPLRALVTGAADTSRAEVEIISGRPQAGIVLCVAGQSAKARVASCEAAASGRTTLTLDNTEPGFSLRNGALLVDAAQRPEIADQVAAMVLWTGPKPMLPGRRYEALCLDGPATATITAIKHRLDSADLDRLAARRLMRGEQGLCNLSFDRPIAFDAFAENRGTGHVLLKDKDSSTVVGHVLISFALRRATNIHWQALQVGRAARAGLKGQRPCCLWFTGLSGSGKSTVAALLEKRLHAMGRHTYVLDGDNVRHGLNRDLGFTDADRVENIRRVAEVSKLMVDAGLIVMVSFISPFRSERRMARELFGEEFLEIYLDTPLEVCEARDPKGLYKKARAGQMKNFTGIDSPYEPPERPEVRLKSGETPPEALVDQLLETLRARGLVAEARGS
jgi:bifunctional enzyme CysN/CysC